MMIFRVSFYLVLCFLFNNSYLKANWTFVCGDYFRELADYRFDEREKNLIPEIVKEGDVIFVKGDLQENFFKNMHPRINSRYILITHNSDEDTPYKGCEQYAKDPKIIKWFGQNIAIPIESTNLVPIPIALNNPYIIHYGNQNKIYSYFKKSQNYKNDRRSIFAYLNIGLGNVPDRHLVYNLLHGKPWLFQASNVPFETYMHHILKSKMVISPRGNGLDTHRTWETLLLGAIPVLRKSNMDSIFEDLPVIIVDSWEEVTPEYLLEKYQIAQKKIKVGLIKPLDPNYWKLKICEAKN